MADPLSVAGLAAGVVSLGIQVSQGITAYIDALQCRDDDIASVRKRNDSLRKMLRVIETPRSHLEGDHQVATTAIRECLDSCNTELIALDNFVIHLTTCDESTTGFIDKVKNKSKRLLYPFSRAKLEQLETRLRDANMALQLALQILGVSVSHLSTKSLVTLEATSHTLSTSFHKVQSEVSAISLPLQSMHGSMSGFEARFDKVEHLLQQLLVQGRAINGSPLEITPEVATGRLLAKPGALKDICDATGTLTSPRGVGPSINHHATRFNHALTTDTGGNLSCLCRHRRRLRTKNVVLGSLVLSSEVATEQHVPGCPATQVMIGTDGSQKVGVTYTGLRRLLNAAVQLSFEMSWGAGAWSLSPSLTYYPSVDSRTAPAFRILTMLSDMWSPLGSARNAAWEKVTMSAMSAISRLFRANKASPRAVDENNQSLIHHLVHYILQTERRSRWVSSQSKSTGSPLLAILKCLIDNGAPASGYDLRGCTPLGKLVLNERWSHLAEGVFADAAELILRSSAEVNLAYLPKPDTPEPDMPNPVSATSRQLFERSASGNTVVIHLLASSTQLSEAYGCGPLSFAILSNNLKQVEQLLRNHPATLAEQNLFLHTPLHLAADKPSCLQLLVKAANPGLLNQTYAFNLGMSALEVAVSLSGPRCQEGVSERLCHWQHCTCDDAVVILLEADSAVPISSRLPHILRRASQRCRLQYIRGMRNRRDRLKQLALDSLPATELEQLGLMSKAVLDSAAPRVIQLLQDRGVQVPEALAPVRDWWPSVYQALHWPGDAQLFFDAGFRDTGSWCDADAAELECMPYHLRKCLLEYLCWMVTHGGASLDLKYSETKRQIFMANYTFWKIGLRLGQDSTIINRIRLDTRVRALGLPRLSVPSPHYDPVYWLQEVNERVLPAEYSDNCNCKCSPGGCTPLISLLKGVPYLKSHFFKPLSVDGGVDKMFSRMRGFLSQVAAFLAEYLEHFGGNFEVKHHTAALRYMTFTALGIPHSCCDPHSTMARNRELVAKLEEEHAYELELLDELLGEFEGRIMAILQDPTWEVDDVISFWRFTWVSRMGEGLDHLHGSDLTEDERRGAEEIGVVWDGPKPPINVDNPYPRTTPEHWLYELEKIEAGC